MNKRESTNVKLEAIINAQNRDEEEEDAVLIEEIKAKIRLRRSTLYGGGARAKIPKLKKVRAHTSKSPFRVAGAQQDSPKAKTLGTSVPPGAHSDQFRVVANPTTAARNDPDRVCINSSSMMQDLLVVPQPPWYFGNNNTVRPPDTTIMTSAARYGFRGSKNIQQYSVQSYEVPSKTVTEQTPGFLAAMGGEDYVNEWVPPILATTVQTVNNLETPKLWPENATYVTGYRKKEFPTSWIYRKDTTVDMAERPKSPESLSLLMSKTRDQTAVLRDYAKMESLKTFQSLPVSSQDKFSKTWGDIVNKNASSALQYNMKRVKPAYEAHTLMDPSDQIKYSGTTAMIVHTQSTDELKFRMRMERSKAKSHTPFQVKWQHVNVYFFSIEKKLKRGQTMARAIRYIAKQLRTAAMRAGSETSMRRSDFIAACQDNKFLNEVSPKQLSHLYSMFDPMKKNSLRFVEIVGCFTVLYMPELSAYDKLKSLWLLYFEFGLDRNIFDVVLEILSCCAYSVPDLNIIDQLFKTEFRPNCYRMSLENSESQQLNRARREAEIAAAAAADAMSDTGSVHSRLSPLRPVSKGSAAASKLNSRSSSFIQPSRVGSATGTRTNTRASNMTTRSSFLRADSLDSDDEDGGLLLGSGAPRKTLSVQPQYNICEQFLDEESLVSVLQQCPKLVAAFDDQLSSRLVQCYGKDVRREEKTDLLDGETEEDKDFTWILKKVAPKKEVFTLS